MPACRFRGTWLLLAVVLAATTALPAPAQEEAAPSLYERLGGLAPIAVVVDDFIERLVVDDVLNANPAIDAARQAVPPAYLKYHVTAMVCQVTGGPCQYHGRGMQEAHAHLNITEGEWDRMVEVFLAVLADHGVPEAETQELVAIVGTTKGDIVQAGM